MKIHLYKILLVGLLSWSAEWAYSQQKIKGDSLSTIQKDSTQGIESGSASPPLEFAQKLPAKNTWEHIVSFPGYVLNLPFWLVNKSIEGAIYVVDENKIVPKVKRVLVSRDGTRIIMPSYKNQIGNGVKITKSKLFSEKSLMVFGANHGLDSRRGIKLYLLENPISKKISFDFTAEHENLYDSKFFGFGPDSKKSDESEYINGQFESEIDFRINITKSLSLEALGGYHYHNITDSSDSEIPLLTKFPELAESDHGVEVDFNLGLTSLALKYNSLNPLGHPLSGTLATLSFQAYRDFSHDTYHFHSTKLDIKKYFHLFYERSLMLRANAEFVRPFHGGSLPFYYMSELGETGTLRGYDRGRFRDRDRILGSLEYRYPIWSPEYRVIEAVVFADAGQVSSDMWTQIDMEKIRYGYGFGIRGYSKKNRVFSLELGMSDEHIRLYFILN